ncbi:MAG: hypothetical protein KGL39_23990 [Patescibacteria group bacterium]|nr:hypothetical protein [Patescibacteria group bacterium]
MLKERSAEIEAYIWSHFKRYVASLLANNGHVKGAALERFDSDPVVEQMRLLLGLDEHSVDEWRQKVIDLLTPAVCVAARQVLTAK